MSLKDSRKRRKYSGKCRQYQRNIIVVDYPGPKRPAVQVLHDYDKVYEGTLRFDSKMSEDDIRYEICQMVKLKKSMFFDFTEITSDDFVFVKCTNRRLRIPDGICS